MKKIVLISSVGGHLEQLLSLSEVIEKYDTHIVTERNNTTKELSKKYTTTYFLPYISRNHLVSFIFNYIKCFFISIKLYLKIKPSVIISTGAGCVLPMIFFGKLMGSKIIFIETFSRIKTKTITGKICYYIADTFIIQWAELKELYPKAVYLNHIY